MLYYIILYYIILYVMHEIIDAEIGACTRIQLINQVWSVRECQHLYEALPKLWKIYYTELVATQKNKITETPRAVIELKILLTERY